MSDEVKPIPDPVVDVDICKDIDAFREKAQMGWFLKELRPMVHVHSPSAPSENPTPMVPAGRATKDFRDSTWGLSSGTTRGASLLNDADMVTDLRPPPEHEDKPLHWVINCNGVETVAHWFNHEGDWLPPGCVIPVTGSVLAKRGYRYLGPAEWSGPAITTHDWDALEHAIVAMRANIAELEAERAEIFRRREPVPLDHKDYKIELGARAIKLLQQNIAELEAENARLRSNPSDTGQGRLIWWPDELQIPFFDGDSGYHTIAPWSVNLTPSHDWTVFTSAPLSYGWHHLPCITTGAALPPVDDKAIDHAGPRDTIHDRAYEVAKDLVNGRITPPSREMIRKALDKADAAPKGRTASDQSLGRAIRLGGDGVPK